MKGKILIGIFLSCTIFGCNLYVDDANPQTSESVEQSKKDDLFIASYSAEQNPAGLFSFGNIWQEKKWYNKGGFFKVTKDLRRKTSWILFEVKENKDSKYTIKNFNSEWYLIQDGTTKYVGSAGGKYELSFSDYNPHKTITLKLLAGKDVKKQIGIITIKRSN